MPTVTSRAHKIPVPVLVAAAVCLVLLAAGVTYLNRPAQTALDQSGASAEAKAYLPNLELSDVAIQATKNFMEQQVVEVQGKIANHGSRKLASIEVYCLFFGADGKEIHRERVPVVRSLDANETRAFRLPFDSLPDTWNEAMPRLAIARIVFAS